MNKKSQIKLFVIIGIILISLTFFILYNNAQYREGEPESDWQIYKRTETTNIYRNSKTGEYQRTIGQGIINYDDKSRRFPNFIPINTTLIQNQTEMYGVTYDYYRDLNLYEAYFKEKSGTSDPWLRPVMVKKDNYVLTMAPQSLKFTGQAKPHIQSSIAVTNGKTITYENQFKNIDLRYNYNPVNLKEELIIDSLEDLGDIGSPSQDSDLILKFKIRSYNVESDNNTNMKINGQRVDFKDSITTETDEEVYFLDENNETIYYFAKPKAYDSAGSQINLNYSLDYNLFGNLVVEFLTPYSWLSNETRVYPVYIDPTITLQDADTENLKDVSSSGEDLTALSYRLYVGFYPFDWNWASTIITFDLSSIPAVDILDSVFSGYIASNSLTPGETMNWSFYYVKPFPDYNVSDVEWNEINWNLLFIPNSSSQYNSSAHLTQTITYTDEDKFVNFNVTSLLKESHNNNDKNVTIWINLTSSVDTEGEETVMFYSKEYTDDTSLRPKLTITYTPYIDIITPTPSQTFTEDAPTTYFNISTAVAMTECYWSEDSGVTNYSMTNYSAYNWTLQNTSMVDGSHTITYSCNQSSDGTWVDSDTVSFDVDSVNVTVCRDLTVAGRNYTLLNTISTIESNVACFYIKNHDISFNMDNHLVQIPGVGGGYGEMGVEINSYDNFTLYNANFQRFDNALRVVNSDNINVTNFKSYIPHVHGIGVSTSNYGIYNNISVDGSTFNDLIRINSGSYNNFTNFNLYGGTEINTKYGIYVVFASDNLFRDGNISNLGDEHIRLRRSTEFINVTYVDESIDDVGVQLTNKWYFDANVTDSLRNPLENADINITNITGTNVFSTSTDASGDIDRTELIEYIASATGRYYHTNHTINVTHDDYIDNSTTYNLTIEHNLFIEYHLTSNLIVSLNIPLNDTSYTTPLEFNCSATTSGNELSNITLRVWNSTGDIYYNATNQTTGFSNESIQTVEFNGDDGIYTWNCLAYNNITESRWASSNNTFYMSTVSPAINLNSPTDNEYLNNGTSVYFNFTATDGDGLDTCELWGNWTGTWHNNYTWVLPESGVMNWTTQNISEGGAYLWNIWCNDTLDNSDFRYGNFTFTIDETFPTLSIDTITTTAGSQTITVENTVSDTNLDECFYSIFNSTGGIDGISENVSFICNTDFGATTTSFGNFDLTIYAIDLATNENSTTQGFTVSTAPTTPPGGGGGVTIISGVEALEAINFTITTLNLKNQMDIALSKDSVKERTKEFLISNEGIDSIDVEVICDTQNVNESTGNVTDICNYVKFDEKFFTVSPNLEERSRGSFTVLTPPNSEVNDIYYFNLLAIRTIGEEKRFSKLSVSARVSRLAILYKWSNIPGTEVKYPVAWISLAISFILFTLLFLGFRKYKMILTGFVVATSVFILNFILLLIFL